MRLRTLVYTALWGLIGIGLLYALFIRPAIDITVAPVRNPQFVVLSDGSIRNTYDIRLRNKHGEMRSFRIQVLGDPAMQVGLEGDLAEVSVPADETTLQRVYVTTPKGSAPATAERTEIRFWVEDLVSGERTYQDSLFNGRTAP